jgi:ankyrin repeat protein
MMPPEEELGTDGNPFEEEQFFEDQTPSLPTDVSVLHKIVNDLSRRLQNAHHTIESQKLRIKTSSYNAEMYRRQIHDLQEKLRLEISKNDQLSRKKIRDEESINYETIKNKSSKLQTDLRVALLDQNVKGLKVPVENPRMQRMRQTLATYEVQQDSQKKILEHLNILDSLTEEFSLACQEGKIAAISTLIQRGVGVNDLDSRGFSPLYTACAHGHTGIAQLLLENGADVNGYLTNLDPLEAAARHGEAAMISLLVDFGASVEAKERCGGTPPLVAAAENGHLDCLELLLMLGANINAADYERNTALHAAAHYRPSKAKGKKVPKNQSPAKQNGSPRKAQALLQAQEDAKDFENPHSAVMINYLLENGANRDIQNVKGYTPLQVAISMPNKYATAALKS